MANPSKWILDRLNLQVKAKRSDVLEIDTTNSNQLFRAIYQFLVQNDVIKYDHNVKTYINKGYAYNPHVYTVINYIARQKTQAIFKVFEVKNKKQLYDYISYKSEGNLNAAKLYKRKALEWAEGSQLQKLLDKPNGTQGFSDWMFEKSGYYELTGESFNYGQTADGLPDNLFTKMYIAPTPMVDVVGGTWQEPCAGYRVMLGFGREVDIDKSRIYHSKAWNPDVDEYGRGLRGLSPLRVLSRSMKRSNEAVDANLALLVNGTPAGFMSNEGDNILSDEERKEAQKWLDTNFGGGKNVKRIFQSASKVSWQQVGLSSIDLQLLESDKHDLGTFCRAYGIDVIIFDPDKSAYNNKITAEKAAWQNTIIPKLNMEVEELNNFIVPGWSEYERKDFFIDYDISHIPCLQADLKELSARLAQEFDRGVWTPNEYAQMVGGDGDQDNPAMNRHYIGGKPIGIESKNELLQQLDGLNNPVLLNTILQALNPEQIQSLIKE